MNKPKISKQKGIELILLEIERGLTFNDTLKVIERKWHITMSSFNRYWKEANSAYSDRQKSLQKIKEEVSAEIAKEAQKKAILTRLERMEIASKIGRGEAWKIGDEVVIPSGSERLKALDYLSKIEGDYSPEKIELTEIKPLEFRILPPKKED